MSFRSFFIPLFFFFFFFFKQKYFYIDNASNRLVGKYYEDIESTSITPWPRNRVNRQAPSASAGAVPLYLPQQLQLEQPVSAWLHSPHLQLLSEQTALTGTMG